MGIPWSPPKIWALPVLNQNGHLLLHVSRVDHGIHLAQGLIAPLVMAWHAGCCLLPGHPHHQANEHHANHFTQGRRGQQDRHHRQKDLGQELKDVGSEDLPGVWVKKGQVQIRGRAFGRLPPSVLILPHLPVKQDAGGDIVSIPCTHGVWNQDIEVDGQNNGDRHQEYGVVPSEAHHISRRSEHDLAGGVANQSVLSFRTELPT